MVATVIQRGGGLRCRCLVPLFLIATSSVVFRTSHSFRLVPHSNSISRHSNNLLLSYLQSQHRFQVNLFHPRTTRMASSSSSSPSPSSLETVPVIPGRPTWHQTMLRIKDPAVSVPFYQNLGFTLIDTFDFPQYQFSLYFLTTLPLDGPKYTLTPGTQEAHDFLWTYDGVTLELTHNHGTESNPNHHYHPGNAERDGFGHIAIKCVPIHDATVRCFSSLSVCVFCEGWVGLEGGTWWG